MSSNLPRIAFRDEWLAARKQLLVKEKEMTRARDALCAERRRLPMVEIDTPRPHRARPSGGLGGAEGARAGAAQRDARLRRLTAPRLHQSLRQWPRSLHEPSPGLQIR